MDRPERWVPVSSKDPVKGFLDLREAYYRLIWFAIPLILPAGLGVALADGLDGPALLVAGGGATLAVGVVVHLLWRTGRGRRRTDAVLIVSSWLCAIAFMIQDPAPAA